MLRMEYAQQINELLGRCSAKNLVDLMNINKILIALSTQQLKYILELLTLLFGQTS